MCLNVRRFPPPSSRIYQLRYIGAETREEGGECNEVDIYGKKEAGTGEHLNTFNQINKHK